MTTSGLLKKGRTRMSISCKQANPRQDHQTRIDYRYSSNIASKLLFSLLPPRVVLRHHAHDMEHLEKGNPTSSYRSHVRPGARTTAATNLAMHETPSRPACWKRKEV